MTVAALILAAGASRRLGRPKQLLVIDWCRSSAGSPSAHARHVMPRASSSVPKEGDVSAALAGLDVSIVYAPDWAEGMAASLRRGVDWAVGAGHDAVATFTCDQPRLSIEHATVLVATYRASSGPRTIVASRYADTLGVPAVFGRARTRAPRPAKAIMVRAPSSVTIAT